jgi:hypothetical protein
MFWGTSLSLHRFDIDPAVSSGGFVTTVTDVVGYGRSWGSRRRGSDLRAAEGFSSAARLPG